MKAMLKKGPRRPNPDVGGLGPGTWDGCDRSGGRPGRSATGRCLVEWAWVRVRADGRAAAMARQLFQDRRVEGGNVGSRLFATGTGSRRPDESASDGGKKCDQPAGFRW